VGIFLDLRQAIESGIPFYRSLNGVIVTPGDDDGIVGTEFFLRVADLGTGADIDVANFSDVAPVARSRSPRRLVHHNSLHEGVFELLLKKVENICWVRCLEALGKMLEIQAS
jgi:hypothetical protein